MSNPRHLTNEDVESYEQAHERAQTIIDLIQGVMVDEPGIRDQYLAPLQVINEQLQIMKDKWDIAVKQA